MKKIVFYVVLLIGLFANQLVMGQTVTITTVPTPPTICAGQVISLTANPSGGIVIGYSWMPGGANTQSINVTPLIPTTYTVTVTFLGNGTAVASQLVTVLVAPTPTITAGGPTTFCQGGNVLLTSSVANSYQWYFNGGIIPGATNQNYTATAAGSYQVFVTVGPCSGMSIATVVTVNPLPVAIVTAGGPTDVCFGGSVLLTAQAGAGYTYQWYSSPNPGGPWNIIPGATNQTYTATTTDSYCVAVTANGCTKFSQ